MKQIFLKLKKRFKNATSKDDPELFAVHDIWAIDACVSGRDPWEDTCLRCGKCGRFKKNN